MPPAAIPSSVVVAMSTAPAPQEELDRRGGRELRRMPEPAPLRIELAAQHVHGLRNQRARQRLARRRELGAPPERVDDLGRLLRHVLAAVPVRVRDRGEELPKRRQAVPRLGRVVRAAEERLAVRREEHRHRPAALSGERDDRVHVERVDVGALLAVDLDVDEPLVHQRGGLLVLERLVLHHVAPVAGGVADREEDRLVLLPGARERLLAPRVPVHRVAGVLEQVRARLLREAVHRDEIMPT